MNKAAGCPLCEHLHDEGATPIPTPALITDEMTLCIGCFQVWKRPEPEEER